MGVELLLHAFLASAVDEVSDSFIPQRHYPRMKASRLLDKRLCGFEMLSECCGEAKNLRRQESNSDYPVNPEA
jgi:hypothetical protein